jgi:hypothetical protein
MGSKRITDGRFSRNYNGKPWNYQLKKSKYFLILGFLYFFADHVWEIDPQMGSMAAILM